MTHNTVPQPPTPTRRRWLAPLLIIGGLLVALVVAVGIVGVVSDPVAKSGGSVAPKLPAVEPVEVPTASPDSDPAVEETEPAPLPSATYNERGNIPKEVGETAAISVEGTNDLKFMFHITDFATTTETPMPAMGGPVNGYFLIISIEGETTEHVTADDWFGWNPHDFRIMTLDGVVVNEVATIESYGAVDESETLPDILGPSQKFVGKVALDTPVEHGYLVYAPMGSATGWEWEF